MNYAATTASAPAADYDHREVATSFLRTVFKLMDYPAQLDFKDMEDGALGVSLHFDSEPPGIRAGKRTHLVDCIQFILNKAVNRPSVPRRWINLDVDRFPELKSPKNGVRPASVASAPESATPRTKASPPSPLATQEDVVVTEDPNWTKVSIALAQKVVALNAPIAVMMHGAEDPARAMKAIQGIAGVRVDAEGAGAWRRLVFRPTAAPSRPKPVDDDED